MSHLLLAGNHRAEVEKKGHNGKPTELIFQDHAFIQACKAYQVLAREKIEATLYTLIDHKGGVRGLTGKRNNRMVLSLTELHPEFSGPFKSILRDHDIPEYELKIIPEKILREHELDLLGRGAFDQSGKCRAFSPEGEPVCRGLAGAYMDFAVRRERKLGSSPTALDWFIESCPPVPSSFTYTQGAQIFRMGMSEGQSVLNTLKIRGWNCTDGQLKLLQLLKPSTPSSSPLASQ